MLAAIRPGHPISLLPTCKVKNFLKTSKTACPTAQGNRIKIREEKYRIHHADMMVANRSIQICIPEVIKIS